MPGRKTILICHSPADKIWAERLHASFAAGKTADTLFWDGTGARAKSGAPRTLVSALAAATHVVVLVSARFLHTSAFRKARRPLRHAAEHGRREARLLLAGHCVWEATWLRDFPVLAGLDCPLDSLNASTRRVVMDRIASEILRSDEPGASRESSARAEMDTPADAAAEEPGSLTKGESSPRELSPYARRLGSVIAWQKQTARQLQARVRMLLLVALGAVAAAVVISPAEQSAALFFIIAGFGVFAASLAFVVWARCTLTEQRVISAQYIRTGFIDATVPSRQRAALTKKADAILGPF